jgi:NAD(P)H-hydrate epimerase
MRYLTWEEARELDRRAEEEFGVPGVVLMENAGRGIAELIRSLGARGAVAVCCGKGNNGGDGLVVARHLANAGLAVRVLLFADPGRLAGDARTNYRIVERMAAAVGPWAPALEVIPGAVETEDVARRLADAGWVVDALFGSGLRGAVPTPYDRVIAAINAAPGAVLAVDIPSGLDADTGRPAGAAVRARHTATVAAPKAGFRDLAAAHYLGTVHVIDMGCPRAALGE